jgi:hypothetical protein
LIWSPKFGLKNSSKLKRINIGIEPSLNCSEGYEAIKGDTAEEEILQELGQAQRLNNTYYK